MPDNNRSAVVSVNCGGFSLPPPPPPLRLYDLIKIGLLYWRPNCSN